MKLFTFKQKKLSKVQKQSRKFLFRRAAWYLLGVILFYAPFAYFNRGMNWLLGNGTEGSIHDTCLRMPLTDLFGSKGLDLLTVRGISFLLLVVSAFLIGPFFCGRLCAAGAFTEYLSRLLPDKWKIDWSKIVNPSPIRYGFLAGFIIAPLATGSLSCSYCGYSFFQRLLDGGFWGDFGVMGSTAILTAFLWLVVFGLFTKGGRGYCTFMCPVGAIQSFLHFLGSKFGFTYKLKFNKSKCVSCQSCVKACPMGALKKEEDEIIYNVHNCITCRQCTSACPTNAILYGRGERGWENKPLPLAPVTEQPTEKGAL